jgi:hypothetical protein
MMTAKPEEYVFQTEKHAMDFASSLHAATGLHYCVERRERLWSTYMLETA